MTKHDAGLITPLPASDSGSAAVWGSKMINPRPQSCLCLTCSGYPSKDDDDDNDDEQCKNLQIVNILSKAMQCKTIDLISAHKLLQTAAEDIAQLRRSFDAVLNEVSTTALIWGLSR